MKFKTDLITEVWKYANILNFHAPRKEEFTNSKNHKPRMDNYLCKDIMKRSKMKSTSNQQRMHLMFLIIKTTEFGSIQQVLKTWGLQHFRITKKL